MRNYITTERLILKPVPREATLELSQSQQRKPSDTSHLNQVLEDHPEVLLDIEELKRVLNFMAEMNNPDAICYGAFLDEQLIGFVNVVHPGGAFPILQYEMKDAFQHKGLGFETVTAFLKAYWTDYAGSSVYAIIQPNNTASIALVRKLGGELLRPKSTLEKILFSLYQISPAAH